MHCVYYLVSTYLLSLAIHQNFKIFMDLAVYTILTIQDYKNCQMAYATVIDPIISKNQTKIEEYLELFSQKCDLVKNRLLAVFKKEIFGWIPRLYASFTGIAAEAFKQNKHSLAADEPAH